MFCPKYDWVVEAELETKYWQTDQLIKEGEVEQLKYENGKHTAQTLISKYFPK